MHIGRLFVVITVLFMLILDTLALGKSPSLEDASRSQPAMFDATLALRSLSATDATHDIHNSRRRGGPPGHRLLMFGDWSHCSTERAPRESSGAGDRGTRYDDARMHATGRWSWLLGVLLGVVNPISYKPYFKLEVLLGPAAGVESFSRIDWLSPCQRFRPIRNRVPEP